MIGLGAPTVGKGWKKKLPLGVGLAVLGVVGTGLGAGVVTGEAGGAGLGVVGAGEGKVNGSNTEVGLAAAWVGVTGLGEAVVWAKAVKGLAVGGKAEGVGTGLGAAPKAGAASSLVLISSPLGKACLNSVLKVPEAGSKTNSVEKLGPLGPSAWAGKVFFSSLFLDCSSKVMAGFKVKLSKADSKKLDC